MDERARVDTTVADSAQPGVLNCDAGPADGGHSAEGSTFKVGDRVSVEDIPLCAFRHMEGVISGRSASNSIYAWDVRLSNGLLVAFTEYELTLLKDAPEPWDGWVAVDSLATDPEGAIHAACTELADVLTRKRKAYGPKAIVDSPYGWEVALITRLHEKFERLVHIQKNPCDSSFEDLAESFKDLAGVAVLGWIHAQEEM